jgi:hypothetical protein
MSVETFERFAQDEGNSLPEHSRTIGARRLRADVLMLRQRRGMVPLAIADTVGVSVTTVSRILREHGVELPAYLTTTGPKVKRPICPHCRRPI